MRNFINLNGRCVNTNYNPSGAKHMAKIMIDLLKESDSTLKNYIK